MNKKAFYKLSSGVYILGSNGSGCVINTLTEVANNPATVIVSVNKENYTHDVIKKNKYFNVSPVTENINMDIIRTFGFSSSKDKNKYEGLNFEKDNHDSLYLTEGVAALFECEVINEIDLGSHTLFIGHVLDCKVLSEKPVMTYEFYQTVKKGLTPPKAPSFKKEKKKGYQCSICGYIYEGEELPSDFICPICGAPHSVFKEV